MPQILFSPSRTEPLEAVVVSFDLTGFSEFCKHPESNSVIHRFQSHLFDELNNFLMSGLDAGIEKIDEFLGFKTARNKVVRPEFIKFTGDGALMIWLTGWDGKFSEPFCTAMAVAMRNLQCRIAEKIPQWEREWGFAGLPKSARFGITKGQVYALKDKDNDSVVDYVGYSINLAVRLQNHCPAVGFLIHKNLNPKLEGLVELQALGMKGTLTEPVLVYENDLHLLKPNYFRTKFRDALPVN